MCEITYITFAPLVTEVTNYNCVIPLHAFSFRLITAPRDRTVTIWAAASIAKAFNGTPARQHFDPYLPDTWLRARVERRLIVQFDVTSVGVRGHRRSTTGSALNPPGVQRVMLWTPDRVARSAAEAVSSLAAKSIRRG